MARITVEDCLKNVNNRFDLVLKAAKRARELSLGAEATLPWDNDKPTVMALREIAENTIRTRELDASEHFDIDIKVETSTKAVIIEESAEAEDFDSEDLLDQEDIAGEADLDDEETQNPDEA